MHPIDEGALIPHRSTVGVSIWIDENDDRRAGTDGSAGWRMNEGGGSHGFCRITVDLAASLAACEPSVVLDATRTVIARRREYEAARQHELDYLRGIHPRGRRGTQRGNLTRHKSRTDALEAELREAEVRWS